MVRHFLWLWILLTATGASAEASSVVVESVVTEPAYSELDATTQNAIQLSIGQPLTREALQREVASVMQRLQALGTYTDVDIVLLKGSKRDHFVVEIQLTRRSPLYGGAFLMRSLDRKMVKRHADFAILLLGSRDAFDSGVLAEVAVAKLHSDLKSDDVELAARNQSIKLTLGKPNLGNSSWFAGVTTLYRDMQSLQNYSIEGLTTSNSDHSVTKAAMMVVGRRFGLFSLAGNATRFHSSARYEGEAETEIWRYWSTDLGIAAKYSNKTFLAAVEPGVELDASFDRAAAPHWDYSSFRWSAAHTFLLRQKQALTPKAVASYSWSPVVSSDGDHTILLRQYDASLQYQSLVTDQWYVSLSGGRRIPWDTHKRFGSEYRNRYGLSLTRHTPHFIFDFSFRYGSPELDREYIEKAYLDGTRFAK